MNKNMQLTKNEIKQKAKQKNNQTTEFTKCEMKNLYVYRFYESTCLLLKRILSHLRYTWFAAISLPG